MQWGPTLYSYKIPEEFKDMLEVGMQSPRSIWEG